MAGYILAGGKSRRMGKNKAFLMLEGRTFLERVQDALSGFDQVYLSVDSRVQYEDRGMPLIEDRYPDVGPMGGIASGLEVCQEEALFVAACDMPYLDRQTVELLRAAYEERRTIVTAKTGEQLHPLLGVYPKSCLPLMQELIRQGNYAMMALLDRAEHTEIQIGEENEAARNINTRQEYRGKLPGVEEAVELLKEQVRAADPEQAERLPLMDALGRILAEDMAAGYSQPPFPRSPLDGYALQARDTAEAGRDHPVCLDVTGEICAGQVYTGVVRKGQAIRIMTGAPIPRGADTVVRQENTDYGREQVRVYERLEPYENYCPAGEDYKQGEVLLRKGIRLDGICMGILAGMGLDMVPVLPLPSVGLISTGDELCEPGTSLLPGKIYDSNRYLIQGRMQEMGLTPAFSIHCADSPERMAEEIRRRAVKAELIITTGGVSVGKKDIMHEVLHLLGARRLFWKVDVKPGSPVLAAVYGETLLICLSGNPFGAAVNFELLVRPVIGRLTGNPAWEMRRQKASFCGVFEKKSGRRRFLRACAEGGEVRLPGKKHEAGILSTFAGCNCLIDIEAGNQGLREGDMVWIHLL